MREKIERIFRVIPRYEKKKEIVSQVKELSRVNVVGWRFAPVEYLEDILLVLKDLSEEQCAGIQKIRLVPWYRSLAFWVGIGGYVSGDGNYYDKVNIVLMPHRSAFRWCLFHEFGHILTNPSALQKLRTEVKFWTMRSLISPEEEAAELFAAKKFKSSPPVRMRTLSSRFFFLFSCILFGWLVLYLSPIDGVFEVVAYWLPRAIVWAILITTMYLWTILRLSSGIILDIPVRLKQLLSKIMFLYKLEKILVPAFIVLALFVSIRFIWTGKQTFSWQSPSILEQKIRQIAQDKLLAPLPPSYLEKKEEASMTVEFISENSAREIFGEVISIPYTPNNSFQKFTGLPEVKISPYQYMLHYSDEGRGKKEWQIVNPEKELTNLPQGKLWHVESLLMFEQPINLSEYRTIIVYFDRIERLTCIWLMGHGPIDIKSDIEKEKQVSFNLADSAWSADKSFELTFYFLLPFANGVRMSKETFPPPIIKIRKIEFIKK